MGLFFEREMVAILVAMLLLYYFVYVYANAKEYVLFTEVKMIVNNIFQLKN